MKKVVLTVAEFCILIKVQESITFSYADPDDFIEENSSKQDSENPDEELPAMVLETKVFDDVIASVQDYIKEQEAGEEKDAAQKLLEKLEAIEEEINAEQVEAATEENPETEEVATEEEVITEPVAETVTDEVGPEEQAEEEK